MLVDGTTETTLDRGFRVGHPCSVVHATTHRWQPAAVRGVRAAGGTIGGVPSAAAHPEGLVPTADISGSAVGHAWGSR